MALACSLIFVWFRLAWFGCLPRALPLTKRLAWISKRTITNEKRRY